MWSRTARTGRQGWGAGGWRLAGNANQDRVVAYRCSGEPVVRKWQAAGCVTITVGVGGGGGASLPCQAEGQLQCARDARVWGRCQPDR